jgi:D-inositol-3-phosphate glycosyltransferase
MTTRQPPAAGAHREQHGSTIHIGLLTGGDDKPYALGIASALAGQGIALDFIGSTAVDGPELHGSPLVHFLNLRGDQQENVSASRKATRILTYYARLVRYAALARPKIFHILWNNKFELFDRTLLMLYYRLLGKRLVFTAHNVNAARRDARDSWINRLSLRIQYRLCHHLFVHTERMKGELVAEFGVRGTSISVIPFGINNTIPTTSLTRGDARQRLGLRDGERTALFFGQIAPYKGLEYLISAMTILAEAGADVRLIIAGKVKRGSAAYWDGIQRAITDAGIRDRIIERIQFIPDDDVEHYFKAADVVVLPYAEIFQSGVPFLAYGFGLPVIATDVGSLRADIIEGRTGFICPPRDPIALAATIQRYFASELYRHLETQRATIRSFASEGHSWTKVGEITESVYRELLCPH